MTKGVTDTNNDTDIEYCPFNVSYKVWMKNMSTWKNCLSNSSDPEHWIYKILIYTQQIGDNAWERCNNCEDWMFWS